MAKTICNICGDTVSILSNHLNKKHPTVSPETYYKTYINSNSGKCLICNNPTEFISITAGFKEYCCFNCGKKGRLLKSNQTKLERYGSTTYNNPNKMKQTKYDKYGEYYINIDKTHQTNMDKYGVPISSKANIVKEKQRQTCKEKYGTDSYLQTKKCREQTKQTLINKYGADHPMHIPAIKNKLIQTNQERYGVDCTFQDRTARLKAIKTMSKNGNRSSLEDMLEQFFIDNNITYEQDYNNDPRYPYFCDFYLPDTDTFIEINGYWTHGKHWFDSLNENDLAILQSWRKKANEGHKQYESAIYVWTELDIIKKEYAIKNKLNYIVLWNKQEIESFIKLYKI